MPEGSSPNTTLAGPNCTGGVPYADPDAPFGDTVTWSLTRNDVDDMFAVDKYSGVLRLAKTAALDYEDTDAYLIEVTGFHCTLEGKKKSFKKTAKWRYKIDDFSVGHRRFHTAMLRVCSVRGRGCAFALALT